MESRAVVSFTAVSIVNPTHAGGRFSWLFWNLNLHDVRISRVRVNAYDDLHVLTLVAFECVGVSTVYFLLALSLKKFLPFALTLPDMFWAPFVLLWFWLAWFWSV